MEKKNNIIIAYPNLVDKITLSGGSWQNMPLNNIKNRHLTHYARSTNLDEKSTQFDIKLDKPRFLKLLTLINHNFSLYAKYRIRTSAVDGDYEYQKTRVVTQYQYDYTQKKYIKQTVTETYFENSENVTYDSGWQDVFGVFYSLDVMEWEDDEFWTCQMTEEEREGYKANLIHIFGDRLQAKYFRIEIQDAFNVSGFIQIGHLFLASNWQPFYNPSYQGYSFGYETDTEVEKSLGGTPYFNKKEPRRVLKFNLNFITKDEAYTKVLEMQRILGVDQYLFVIPFPDNNNYLMKQAFLGRKRVLNQISNPNEFFYDNSFEIEEITQ